MNLPSPAIVKNERLFLTALAGIQFTHILDFMIVMPLGPQLIRSLELNTQQFGLLLSCYTLSAAVFSFFAASYVDRFDRRKLMLILYALFIVATICCGLAPSYLFLVVARALAGAFGGILSAMTQTIIADVIPYERRGRAMGVVMTSFSLATVLGVPLGLFFAHNIPLLAWRAPFVFVASVALLFWLISIKALPSLVSHLSHEKTGPVWKQTLAVLKEPNHLRAFAFIATLMMAGFTVTPFIALYLTTNVNVPESFISIIYFCGGAATLFSARLIGRMSDHYGKQKMLRAIVLCSLASLIITTNLVPIPLWLVLINSMCYFVLMSGRHIPGTALVTQAVKPEVRGAFMSLVSSVKMLSAGVASLITGAVISQNAAGQIENFNVMGYVAAACAICAIWLAYQLRIEGEGGA